MAFEKPGWFRGYGAEARMSREMIFDPLLPELRCDVGYQNVGPESGTYERAFTQPFRLEFIPEVKLISRSLMFEGMERQPTYSRGSTL